MNPGHLSQYFEKVAAKRLSAVEADTAVSHQHEFNGTKALKEVLGTGDGEKIQFQTTFFWFGDDKEPVSCEGNLTWYDARLAHPTRSEYRLYFPTTEVSELARAGDLMLIARRSNGIIMIIVAAAGSTIEQQLLWLFKIPGQIGLDFISQDLRRDKDTTMDFAARFILDELNIEIEDADADYFDTILAKYQGKFPTTREFSVLTRNTLTDVNPLDDPDGAVMAWLNHEEKLFRRLEKYEVEQRLRQGFVQGNDIDVDGFIQFSLSVQNRRKSRAGFALENHLEEIFRTHKLRYDRTAETENKAKPDFLFPGVQSYRDPGFSAALLTMLGVKTTCKDRWRQVLSEAERIPAKHLLTLEPGISENQTREMQAQGLQLVVPKGIHVSYGDGQRGWLMDVKEFIEMVGYRQARC